ncbi:fatty acid synthase-like [Vespula maculifrons]|uniref:Fatty acid synthase-like n=1 Tax=Vespula maculifrons TaxID=7453 RepID=A0ABD2CT33_VESMC
MNAYVGVKAIELRIELKKFNSCDEKVNVFFNILSPEHMELFLKGDRRKTILSLYVRLQVFIAYNPESMPYLRKPITLFKPLFLFVTEGKVDVHIVEGNHITVLCAPEILMAINGEPFENATLFNEYVIYANPKPGEVISDYARRFPEANNV